MAGKQSLTDGRPGSAKPRPLALEPLEDRSVPASLAAHAPPLPQPDPEVALVRVAPTQAPAAAVAQPGAPLGKLAANHNLTLVRDRRGRKPRRR